MTLYDQELKKTTSIIHNIVIAKRLKCDITISCYGTERKAYVTL